MAKTYWRAETGLFLGLWLTLMVAGRSQLLRDPGILWHTVVGQRILSSGLMIRTDPFSFTFKGEPWISRQWICECAMALVHQVSGLDGLLLATVTALAGLYTWVAHRLIRAGIHWMLAMLITVLAMAASSFHFHPRPHLVTLVLLGWTFARLCDFEAGRIPFRKLLWLVPLFVVWTNAHDGVLGGIATVALTVLGWGLVGLIGHKGPLASGRLFVPAVGLVVACGLTVFVNPFGVELIRAWFSLLGSPVLPRLFDEHGPLLARPGGKMVLPFALFYAAAFVGILPRRPRVTWFIPLVWLLLAFTRIRHAPLFAITAVIALGDLFPQVCWAAWLSRHGSDFFTLRAPGPVSSRWRPDFRPAVLPLVVVLMALVCQVAGLRVPVLGRGWAKLDPSYWPVDLLPDLRRFEQDRPNGTPIFNEMLFGGFLIYHTPGLRVFIDDRCELYGDAGLLAYEHALRQDPAQVDRWAQDYQFDAALTQTGSPFDRYLAGASGWTLVRRGAAATFYRRILPSTGLAESSSRR